MYINTRSYQDMMQSVCEVLNINNNQLDDLLEGCYQRFQVNHPVFILDNQYHYFLDYIKDHLVVDIDEILFVHLARRLNTDSDNNGYSLIDVLVNDTALSNFLKKYGLTFKYEQYIRMFKDNVEIDLFDDNEISNYLRYRFGYIIDDFIEHSKLYKFEYLVPTDKIWFENYEELNYKEKQYHLIVKVLQRLYANKYEKNVFDDDNPVIGIKDNISLKEDLLISKIEIR